MDSWEQRALAFSGIVQAAFLVNTLAQRGMASQDALTASLATIRVTDPDSVLDVYPEPGAVNPGLKIAAESLGRFNRQHAEMIRYVFALTQLERRLQKAPGMITALGERISALDPASEPPGMAEYAALAAIYEDLPGQLEPRIIVRGDRAVLTNTNNVNRIRALLLAGLRSAVLWRQVGGRSWQLVFRRRHYLHAIDTLRTHYHQLVSNSN